MKKIVILFCVIVSMGFTVANEDNAGDIAQTQAPKKMKRTGGYLETTSPQSYTLTLQ